MGLRLVVLVACTLGVASPVSGQGPGAASAASQPAARRKAWPSCSTVSRRCCRSGDRAGFISLVDDRRGSGRRWSCSGAISSSPARSRVVVNERDRAPLENSLPGNGYRLVVEMFTETSGRARIVTALLDVRRPNDGGADAWRITAAQGLTSVEGLYRLRIDTAAYYDVARPDHHGARISSSRSTRDRCSWWRAKPARPGWCSSAAG